MKRTFLLDIDLGDSTDLIGTAAEIADAVADRGLNVLECRVWRSRNDLQTPAGPVAAPLPVKPPSPLLPPSTP